MQVQRGAEGWWEQASTSTASKTAGHGSNASRWARASDAPAPRADPPPDIPAKEASASQEIAYPFPMPRTAAMEAYSKTVPADSKEEADDATKAIESLSIETRDEQAQKTSTAAGKKLDWATADDDAEIDLPQFSPVLPRTTAQAASAPAAVEPKAAHTSSEVSTAPQTSTTTQRARRTGPGQSAIFSRLTGGLLSAETNSRQTYRK